MIDIYVKITIDEEHEEEFKRIMEDITKIKGIVGVNVDVDSYYEYNIDSEPFYEEEEE
jgi:NADPH-dependent 7-cyano-7-deazaguanine reductase QueF